MILVKRIIGKLLHSQFAMANIGYTLGNCAIRSISVLSIPIFTYLLSVEDYGLVTTFFAYQSLLALITGLSLHSSILSANREFPGEINSYLVSISSLQIFLFVIVLAIFGSLHYFGINLFNFTFASLALLSVLALTSNIQSTYRQYLSLNYDYGKTLAINLAVMGANLLFSVFFILFLFSDSRYLGRIGGSAIAGCLISLYILFVLFKKSKLRLNWSHIQFGLSYSWPVVPHGLSREFIAQFPKIIIQLTVGNFATGLYGFAFTIAAIPQLIGSSLDTVWSAWFFENIERNQEEVRLRARAYLATFSFLLIPVITLSPEIVFLLAPKRYWEATEIVIPALMCAYCLFLFCFPGAVEYYKKRTKLIALASMGAALINACLIIVFVPRYGYVSALFISLVTYTIYVAFHTYNSERLIPGLYDYSRMGKIIFITVCSAIASQFFIDSLAMRLVSSGIALFLVIRSNRDLLLKYLLDDRKLEISK